MTLIALTESLSLQPAGLLDLPKEILDSVMEHLDDDRRALIACCLVCHRLLPGSQEILFSQWTPNYASELEIVQSFEQLSDIIMHSPHIGGYIREFKVLIGPSTALRLSASELRMAPFKETPYADGTNPFLLRILPALSKIRMLHVRPLFVLDRIDWQNNSDVPQDLRVVLDALLLNGATLEHIVINLIDNFDLGVFCMASNARCLTMDEVSLCGNTSAGYVPTNMSLKSTQGKHKFKSIACILNKRHSPAEFVNYCLGNSWAFDLSSLSQLTLHDTTDGGSNPLSRLLRHCSSTLVDLGLAYTTSIAPSWENPDLSSLVNLSTLRFELAVVYYDDLFPHAPSHQDRCKQAIRILRTVTRETKLSKITFLFRLASLGSKDSPQDVITTYHNWGLVDDTISELKHTRLPHLTTVNLVYRTNQTRFTEPLSVEAIAEIPEELFLKTRALGITVSRWFDSNSINIMTIKWW